MHFLMMYVWGQGFISNFQGKKVIEMCVGLLISREILFSVAVLLFWASFFLQNVKEGNIFKLNEITWKKKG